MLRTSMTKKQSRQSMPHHPPPRIHPIPKLNEYSQLVTLLLAKLKPTPDADTLLQTLRHHRRARRMFVESQQEGLVAQQPVRVGQMIMEMNGYVALATEIATGDYVFRYDGLGLKKQICIDTSALGNDTKVTRRSCAPNSVLEHVLGSGATLGVMIVAQKYIPRNEEITLPFDVDYKDSEVALECAAHREDILACPFEQERRSTRRLNQERKDSEGIASQRNIPEGVPTSSTAPSTHTNYRSVPSRAERRKALQDVAIPPAETPKTPSAQTISAAKRPRPLPGNMGENIEQGKENESEKKKDSENSPSTENNFLVQLDSRFRSHSKFQTSQKLDDVPTSSASSSSLSEVHQPDVVPTSSTAKVQISRRLSNRSQAISKTPTNSCQISERKSPRAAVKRPRPSFGNLGEEVVEKAKCSDNNAHVLQPNSRRSHSKSHTSKIEDKPTSSSHEGQQSDTVPTSSAASGGSENPPTFEAHAQLKKERSLASPAAPKPNGTTSMAPSTSNRRLSNRDRAATGTLPMNKDRRNIGRLSTSNSRHEPLKMRLVDLGGLMKENAMLNATEEGFEPPTGFTNVTTCSPWAKDAPELRREVEDQNTPGPTTVTLAASSKRKSSVNKDPLTDRRSHYQEQNREEPGTSAGVRHARTSDVCEENVLKYKRRRDD